MTQSVNGKLVMRYVGKYGRHTDLLINDVLVKTSFNTNKSLMLMLWCVCDYHNIKVERALILDSNAIVSYDFKNIFKPELYSKYDVMYNSNAVGNAYLLFTDGKYVQDVINILQAFYLHVQKVFKLDNLSVIYKLDDGEIYDKI